ncbi:MAG TPA: complex I NDUFA9 subunit family protein [Rhodobacterales bacterium]|nr:complex I NDUFA9 subunit family protein [Rhodobacterales bacterium]
MSKLVTIYGGSGFVGRYVTQRMARAGWRVRVAVRRPNEGVFVKTYGAVGQVEPVLCNVRDDASVRAAARGADAVVNCVGILNELGKNSFDAVHTEAAERIARIAADEGVANLVHISSIGADPEADYAYARSKGLGEQGVLAAFPDAVILRPSVIFGAEAQFFNRFAAMARLSLVLPVVGADSLMQPVYVDDVAAAAEKAATGQAPAGVYELGGPEVESLRDLLSGMLEIIERRRLILNMPFWLGRFMAFWFDLWQTVSGGLIVSPLTRDQVRALGHDNVVSPGARGFGDLGIAPQPMATVLPEYLYRYRPDGQYAAIRNSARNLEV